MLKKIDMYETGRPGKVCLNGGKYYVFVHLKNVYIVLLNILSQNRTILIDFGIYRVGQNITPHPRLYCKFTLESPSEKKIKIA